MKLVVGLGNPGSRYADTRHNVGFRVVERFAERHRIALDAQRFEGRFGRARLGGLDVGLLLPETMMNLSGAAVGAALRMLPVGDPTEDLVLVFDDLDLPFGRLRLRPDGGAGGHRGMQDVIARLGGGDFPRLRVGIGRPPPEMDPVAYVLARFAPEERRQLPALLDAAAGALDATLRDGVTMAMNRVNQLRSPAEKDPAAE
jgi:PTH1 family peptidyl-tRNA hydrolase